MFVAPALLVLALMLGYPILQSWWLSFQRVQLQAGRASETWTGLDNYIRLFADATFLQAAANSALFCLVEVVLVTLIALAVALLLNHPLGRGGIWKIMLIIPWAIAPVAHGVLWKWILNSNYGILNGLLMQLGVIDSYQVWLGSPVSAMAFLLLVDIWKSVPFIALLLLAGLQRIPQSLYRAAYMDGARPGAAFRHITLPQLRGAIAIAVILQTIWSLRVFDIIFVLTSGGPADATVMMNFMAYRTTFNFLDIGYGAAIANVIFIVTVLLAIIYIRLLQPREPGAAK